MLSTIRTIDDVRSQRLCSGCGACAFISPDVYRIEDIEDEGRRPARVLGDTGTVPSSKERDALAVCPGSSLDLPPTTVPAEFASLTAGWGPVNGLWEGYSSDETIRFRGSSGGAITALALHAIEGAGFSGALHTIASPDNPILNQTVYSVNRDELLRGAGSRYSPASPCERLDLIEAAAGKSVFIGKPCDVAAVRKVVQVRPAMGDKVGLTIALFCAGTPSTAGTKALLKAMKLKDGDPVTAFRYRGHGWPGRATAETASGDSQSLSYDESWGKILTKHVQWRCRVCIDHTGEFADIAVGDPWYRTPTDNEGGASLIVSRTERGRNFVLEAIASGKLVANQVAPEILPASQPNLLRTRGMVWGRILGSRLVGAAAPRYSGMPTFRFWWSELGFAQKAQSILGTMRRLVTKQLRQKRRIPENRQSSGK